MVQSRSLERVLIGVTVLALAGIAALLLVGWGSSSSPQNTASIFSGPALPPGVRAPDFTLLDQDGRPTSLSALNGRVVIVSFVHSKCQETCPLAAETIRGALDLLPAATAAGVSAIAVTAAPSEDTPSARRAFLARHHLTGRMAYLGGDRRALQPIWDGFHVLPEPVSAKSDVHTTITFLIDRRGIERIGFPDGRMTPEDLAHDLRVLARQRA